MLRTLIILRLVLISFTSLLIEILTHFKRAISQPFSNTIRVIVEFELFCRDKRFFSSLALFSFIFHVEDFAIARVVQGCPWPKCNMRVTLPPKNAKWKDYFIFFKIPIGVVLPSFWRVDKVSNNIGRLEFSDGYHSIIVVA